MTQPERWEPTDAELVALDTELRAFGNMLILRPGLYQILRAVGPMITARAIREAASCR